MMLACRQAWFRGMGWDGVGSGDDREAPSMQPAWPGVDIQHEGEGLGVEGLSRSTEFLPGGDYNMRLWRGMDGSSSEDDGGRCCRTGISRRFSCTVGMG
jgi:hypothetical protein